MIYVCSDLHGYPLDKFTELLNESGFGRDDFLYVLGDVIDRGEDGIKLLRWFSTKSNIQLLLGNHEAMMLSCSFILDEITDSSIRGFDARKMHLLSNWMGNGAGPTMNALKLLHNGVREGIFDFVGDLPLYEEVNVNNQTFLLMHSPPPLNKFRENKPLSAYKEEDLLWTRPALYDRYYEDKTIIFGHTPTKFYGERYEGKVILSDTWIDIDTGAAAGLPPTILCLDTMQAFQPGGVKENIIIDNRRKK